MVLSRNRLKIILFSVSSILMIPLVAMHMTDEVNWSFFDFLVMGILLLSIGLLIELILRKVKNIPYRILFLFSIGIVFLLTWAELAVGIFGSSFAGN